MKIVYVAPFGLRQKTTVWARTLPLAQELVRNNHGATIVIPPWDSKEDAGREYAEAGVQLVNVPLNGGIPAVVRRMIHEIDSLHPDIVHIVKPRAHAGLVQWWLWRRKQRETALLLDVDDWEQSWAEINSYPLPVSRFLAWQEEWGLRHADAVTAASHWLVDRAQQYCPKSPVLYLPNGVRSPNVAAVTPQAAGQRDPKLPVVLFYSRFVEVEPEWLARFWVKVVTALPTARLKIAGSAFQAGREEAYRLQVAQLAANAARHIDWLGFVDPTQQALLYSTVTCAIFPACAVPLQQAKCSVRLATTLLNGVPVVASAVGEQQYYGAGGGARLVPADATPEEFAVATIETLESQEVQTTMVQRAQIHLHQSYDWKRLGLSLIDFYAETLRRRGGADLET